VVAIVATSNKFDGTTWSAIASTPRHWSFHQQLLTERISNIMGGCCGRYRCPANTNYRYNVATNTYTTLAPSPTSVWSQSAVYLAGKDLQDRWYRRCSFYCSRYLYYCNKYLDIRCCLSYCKRFCICDYPGRFYLCCRWYRCCWYNKNL